MTWAIRFDEVAQKQLKKLDKEDARRIVDYLEDLSGLEDVLVRGKALTGNLAGLWRYRVGDYRIICDVHAKEVTIYVVEVGHRKDIYD
ncbi:MAG: type II toxin-antitoxin system RelE/ParE family toxin [Coriobacteriales bacterium]|nr:type II toxin-antitoxin system RelE/ParE family toxin [Coriobacteriales bacterium]